jgi:hypothetical protein
MTIPGDDLDLDAVRRDLEARRHSTRERLASLARRPERGSAVGFGKRVGDGTTEAVRSRQADYGLCLILCCVGAARNLNGARRYRAGVS